MTYQEIVDEIKRKSSYLCIGLDTDPEKIPSHLLGLEDPVFEFNKQIIDATHDLCVAYKPNTAFYESNGLKGWASLEKTAEYLRQTGTLFSIADAKRGDIGNTSKMYAKAFLKNLNFDAITVAPYMGEDSVSPFLSYPGKWAILLALTSNAGAADFQVLNTGSGALFEEVLASSKKWGTKENMMYVVGATKADMFKQIRAHVPDHFLLVPGVGAQGGSLEDVSRYGMNSNCGLLVNASRSILFASSGTDFATKARQEALSMREAMKRMLDQYCR